MCVCLCQSVFHVYYSLTAVEAGEAAHGRGNRALLIRM